VSNRIGALIFTPIGFAIGGFIGAGIGYAAADTSVPYQTRRRELDAERKGGVIGALVGATIVAVLVAGPAPDEPPKPTVGTSGSPPLRFP
jgi:uncharacterized oligopeptide transporter (OPT) family protein